MENLKKCIASKHLKALSLDAGPFLLTLREEYLKNYDKEFCVNILIDDVQISIVQNKQLFPFFNIQKNEEFLGIAALLKDGVGRIFLSTKIYEHYIQTITKLFYPCLCKAGHLIVIKFHFTGEVFCECISSSLSYIQKTKKTQNLCPITKKEEISVETYQNYAIAITKQRQRINCSFKNENDQNNI